MQNAMKWDFPQDLGENLEVLIKAFRILGDSARCEFIVNRIHLATNEMMSEIPLNMLHFLREMAQKTNSQKALKAIDKEIKLNLETKDLNRRAQALKQAIMQDNGWTEADWERLNDWQDLK